MNKNVFDLKNLKTNLCPSHILLTIWIILVKKKKEKKVSIEERLPRELIGCYRHNTGSMETSGSFH